MQNNKKTFQQPQILAFWWFFKLCPEENPTKNLQTDKGRVEIGKKIQSTFTDREERGRSEAESRVDIVRTGSWEGII